MAINDTIKAWFARKFQNPFYSPDRALRKLGLNVDEIFPFINSKHVEDIYAKAKNEMTQGKKELFFSETKKFVDQLIIDIKIIENSEKGVFWLLEKKHERIRKAVELLEETLKKIDNIKSDQTINLKNNIVIELRNIKQEIAKVMKMINEEFRNSEKLQKMIKYNRNQLAGHAFMTTDTKMKGTLAFEYSKEKSLGKDEENHIKRIETMLKSIQHELTPKTSQFVSKAAKKETEALIKDIREDMENLQLEMKYLAILLTHIFEGQETLKTKVLTYIRTTGLSYSEQQSLKNEFERVNKEILDTAGTQEERAVAGEKALAAFN